MNTPILSLLLNIFEQTNLLMRNTVFKIIIFVFCLSTSCYSQDFSSLWQGHYSYNKIIDVVSGGDKIYAAAENAIFEYDVFTGELNTITTVEGLSGEQITTIYYSEIYQSLLIGYETGLIEVYSETDADVFTVVDILEKQNITPVNKRINHFYENEGLIYISTDYGISVYDLERLEFGDTYFLGNGGSQITVKQVSILNNEIYAACLNSNGIKRADLSNPNLIDFQQWQTLINGDYYTMSTINNTVYAVRSNRVLYEIDGASINTLLLLTLPLLPLDAEVSDTNLIFSATDAVYVYDENIQLVNTFQPTADYDTSFSSAAILDEFIYIGTVDIGLLRSQISDNSLYVEIKPNGPLENDTFRLDATTQTVWATYGKYTEALNPYPLTSKGISYLYNDTWSSLPIDSLFGARELNEITPNIFNPNQVFISSFFNGLLELNNREPTILLNETNSGLESLVLPSDPNYIDIRVSASEFDRDGLLWSVTSRVDKALKSLQVIGKGIVFLAS